MSTANAYAHIVKANGEPARLENNRRWRVAQVVMDYLAHGRTPDEIVLHHPGLTPAEVHSAMAYYYDHQEEIDAEIRAELDQLDQESKTKQPSPIYWKLKAKGLI